MNKEKVKLFSRFWNFSIRSHAFWSHDRAFDLSTYYGPDRILAGLGFVLVYIEDDVVLSDTIDEDYEHLKRVLERIE